MVSIIFCKRKKKGRIENISGRLSFPNNEEANKLMDLVQAGDPTIEVFVIGDSRNTLPKSLGASRFYCPHCGYSGSWGMSVMGRCCPVCGISDSEYDVRRVNNLFK